MTAIAPSKPGNIQRIQSLLEQEGPFLSLSQAARQTGIPLQTLSSAVYAGRLPALTMPDGRKYVPLAAVLTVFSKSVDSSAVWQARLLAAGLVNEIKPRATRRPIQTDFEPVAISGEPIAETIKRERR